MDDIIITDDMLEIISEGLFNDAQALAFLEDEIDYILEQYDAE